MSISLMAMARKQNREVSLAVTINLSAMDNNKQRYRLTTGFVRTVSFKVTTTTLRTWKGLMHEKGKHGVFSNIESYY